MTRVLAFGTFDYFHPGHLAYLRQAAALGTELIVVVARDKNVLAIKGRAPRQDEKYRRRIIARELRQEKINGRAVLGALKDRLLVLKKYSPDIIAAGYDQAINRPALRKQLDALKLKTEIKRLRSYHPEKYKSSFCRHEMV